jgi:TonB family protein
MKAFHLIAWCSVVIGICCVVSLAQSPDLKTQHYSRDGLSFEYGEGWKLTDRSNELAQHLLLARDGSSSQIMILAYRYFVTTPERLAEARRDVTELFIDKTTRTLHTGDSSVKREDAQLKVGDDLAVGVRLHGRSNKESTTAEIYSFLGKLRFINLAYIRSDKDSAQDDSSWLTVLDTLKIAVPLPGSKEFDTQPLLFLEEKLNDLATSMPYPEYPRAARYRGVRGTVIVRVIIDEKGDVEEVFAVSGHPALVKAAEEAARKSKFGRALISGRAVRVTGLFTYNFVGPH